MMTIRLAGIVCTPEQYTDAQLIHLMATQLPVHRVWLSKENKPEKELEPFVSRQVREHSQRGFNWGYFGSGPFQLALAVCLELFGEKKAVPVYKCFMERFIVLLPFGEDFEVVLDLTGFITEHQDQLLSPSL